MTTPDPETAALIKAMISAELIMRDNARKNDDQGMAQCHGDRAQVLKELLDKLSQAPAPVVTDAMRERAHLAWKKYSGPRGGRLDAALEAALGTEASHD